MTELFVPRVETGTSDLVLLSAIYYFLVIVIVGSQEGNGVLDLHSLLQSVVNLVLVVFLLKQNEGCCKNRSTCVTQESAVLS